MKEGNLRPDRILGGEKKYSKPKAKPNKPSKKSQVQTAKKPAAQPQTQTEEEREEKRRQQTLVDVFGSTFASVLGADDFASRLQELKTALFNRDFEAAFARSEATLDVYAARWSPTRALCYGRVLRRLDEHLRLLLDECSVVVGGELDSRSRSREIEENETETETTEAGTGPGTGTGTDTTSEDQDENVMAGKLQSLELEKQEKEQEEPLSSVVTKKKKEKKTQTLKVLAIGGAAAEIVALADYLSSCDTDDNTTTTIKTDLTLLDVGPWGSVVQRLHKALVPSLVSAETFHSNFAQKDILSLNADELTKLLQHQHPTQEANTQPVLITLLFTLNELYTAGGIKQTTAFLRLLTTTVPRGTLLLVVDSPGSYSEAAVGKDAKKYPMQWLMDHTLVPNPRKTQDASSNSNDGNGNGNGVEEVKEPKKQKGIKWERLESDDSVWFRVAEGLKYPIPLENMRYQMHLYRAS